MCFFGILTKLRIVSCLKQTVRSYKQKLNMNTIYFRHQNEEKQFQINFRYINQGFGIDRDFNFIRSENEKIDVCLERIRTNVEKEFVKKLKKEKKKSAKKTAQLTSNEKPEESQLVRYN